MASRRVRFEALDDTPPSLGVFGGLISSALLACAVVAVAFLTESQMAVEKIATMLVQPVGLMWLALFGCIWIAWRRDSTVLAVTLLVIWLWISIWGNGIIAGWIQHSLEGKYEQIDPMAIEPDELAAVALLGGGTCTGPGGRDQLGPSGDRVMLAARLYHAKKVNKIICTGANLNDDDPSASPAHQAKTLLVQVGVKVEDIDEIAGRNTSEEIAELKKWRDQAGSEQTDSETSPDQDPKIGVITSSWHMARVEALAERSSLEITPLPCDFDASKRWSLRYIVPSADAMQDNAVGIKEYLARLMQR